MGVHLSLDHLGSVRTTTNGGGAVVGKKKFYPFGEEATPFFEQAAIALKYTGHERDSYDPTATGDDRDYMHARFYLPITGRFLSPDSALDLKRTLPEPQGWNRYPYVLGNPLRFVDPTGELSFVFTFEGSTLSPRQQRVIMKGIQGVYERAGVKNVQVFLASDKDAPKANASGGPDAVVPIAFRVALEDGGFGSWTPSSQEASVSVSGHVPSSGVRGRGRGRMAGFRPRVGAEPVGRPAQASARG